jgi:hypothetical protein
VALAQVDQLPDDEAGAAVGVQVQRLAAEQPPEVLEVGVPVLGMDHRGVAGRQQGRLGVADQRAQGGVDLEEAAVGADHGGGHRGGGQGAPDPLQLVGGQGHDPDRRCPPAQLGEGPVPGGSSAAAFAAPGGRRR